MKFVVTVKPGSKTDEIVMNGADLLVKTKAPAREGKANLAVVQIIAAHFKVPRSAVRIISGLHSKKKIIEVGQI